MNQKVLVSQKCFDFKFQWVKQDVTEALANFKDSIHATKYADASIFTLALTTKHKIGTT